MVVVMFWCHVQSICLKQVTGGTRYDEDHRSILKGVIIPESPLFMFTRSSNFGSIILICSFATNAKT